MTVNSLEDERAPRNKVRVRAIATSPVNSFSLPCIIRNMSADGAKIYTKNLDYLPDKILLEIAGVENGMQAQIIWRQGNYAGIKIDWTNTLFNT
jgi:PilZ domain